MNGGQEMTVNIAPEIFSRFPDLEVGLVSVRGLDNLGTDREIEAYFRHVLLEAGLLLKLKPVEKDPSILLLREKLSAMGAADAVSSAEALLAEFSDGIEREKDADETFAPGKTVGLIGLSALSRETPVTDLVRAASLEARLPVLAFDMGNRAELLVREARAGDVFPIEGKEETVPAGEPVWTFADAVSVRHLFGKQGAAGRVTGETRNLLLAVPCFAASRRRAMSVRNELARRLLDSFGRDTETGWLSAEAPAFVSEK